VWTADELAKARGTHSYDTLQYCTVHTMHCTAHSVQTLQHRPALLYFDFCCGVVWRGVWCGVVWCGILPWDKQAVCVDREQVY
jgi:hypothetical protein